MPVEFGLEFMAAIGTDHLDPLAALGFLTPYIHCDTFWPLGLLLRKLEVSRQFVHSYTLTFPWGRQTEPTTSALSMRRP